MGIGRESFRYRVMFFDMNVSNSKSKNLVLASTLKQNLSKIRNWLRAPELIMAPLKIFSLIDIVNLLCFGLKSLDKVTARIECNISKCYGTKFRSSIIFSQNTNLNYSKNKPC